MKTENVTAFITSDGKKFLDEKEAELHEKELNKNTKAFYVRYSPDLNETGMLQKSGYIICKAKWNHNLYVEDWLYREFGNRVAFVQGVAPAQAWMFKELDNLSQVDEANILTRINK